MVNVLKYGTPKFLTKWTMQTVQTKIRLLLKEQSDLGLHCLLFYTVCHFTNLKKFGRGCAAGLLSTPPIHTSRLTKQTYSYYFHVKRYLIHIIEVY